MTVLGQIAETKRRRVEALKQVTDMAALLSAAREARERTTPERLRASLNEGEKLNVIAEFKRASPSKGVINEAFGAAEIARAYELGGASAISVLTEEDHFRGSLDDLIDIRRTVGLPVLRKDFIFDEFQILEAAAAGADAVLLIVGLLSEDELFRLRIIVEDELGMDALVEVHTVEEMKIADAIGATLIGVNNRDLTTFNVSLDVSRRLAQQAPAAATLVAESGLRTHADLIELRSFGYSGFLIGESLMRSDDPADALRGLIREKQQ